MPIANKKPLYGEEVIGKLLRAISYDVTTKYYRFSDFVKIDKYKHFASKDLEGLDPIIGVEVSKEGTLMLMDASLSEEEVSSINALLENNRDITSFHHLRTRQSGSDKFIAVHVVFNVSITLYDAHRISDHIEDDIRQLFSNDRVHSIIHMDPYDDSDINEDEY